jgi:hypothetical protein
MGFISGRGLKLLEDRIGSAEAPDVGFFLEHLDPAPVPVIGDQPAKSRDRVEQQVLLPRIALPILAADETDAGVLHAIETNSMSHSFQEPWS